MSSLIIASSRSEHDNTTRLAAEMADEIGAEVYHPRDVTQKLIDSADLLGFGSGIYLMRFGKDLTHLVQSLPVVQGVPAFTFATSGMPEPGLIHYSRDFSEALSARGFDVKSHFQCRGHDTAGPLRLIGGVHRNHPDAEDFRNARRFARNIAHKHLH